MTFRKTSISFIGFLACVGTAAQAQSDQVPTYCDVGYMLADQNEDGRVSADENTAAMERAYSDLDANDDGSISRDEYINCSSGWAQNVEDSQTRSEEDMAALDTNSDGNIDQEEFMSAAEDAMRTRWGPMPSENKVDAMQEASDNDTSSDMSTSDSSDSSSDMGGDQASTDSSTMNTESSESADMSGNATSGSASMNEDAERMIGRVIFLTPGQSQNMSRDDMAARASQKFFILDRNNNRMIDATEWVEQAQAEQRVRDRADQDFSRMDTDSSGDISREEYQNESMRRWDFAQSQDSSENNDVGPPVVLYRYQDPM